MIERYISAKNILSVYFCEECKPPPKAIYSSETMHHSIIFILPFGHGFLRNVAFHVIGRFEFLFEKNESKILSGML